jgi:hypothetical protein
MNTNNWRIVVIAANTEDNDTDYQFEGTLSAAKMSALESLNNWPDATDALVMDSENQIFERFRMAAPHGI